LAFYPKNYEHSNETDEDIFGNRIIILKMVKSIRQLRRTEKELVRLNYKEAIIKGFTLKGIQQYIASKTKIWIEWSCLEYLKKAEEQENREWYVHMARDHFAYVGAYRKCIYEVEQLKKELWNIIMDTKAAMYVRIQATKELHSLSKTSVLLLRDLPFVTNLSKYYDENMLNPNYNNTKQLKNGYPNNNNRETIKNPIQSEDFDKPKISDNPFDFNVNGDNNLNINLKNYNTNPSRKYKQLDDEVMETMKSQLNYSDGTISPDHLASIKRLKEIFDD
jgi:hypothetical protein